MDTTAADDSLASALQAIVAAAAVPGTGSTQSVGEGEVSDLMSAAAVPSISVPPLACCKDQPTSCTVVVQPSGGASSLLNFRRALVNLVVEGSLQRWYLRCTDAFVRWRELSAEDEMLVQEVDSTLWGYGGR
jgi:hypothetical protein